MNDPPPPSGSNPPGALYFGFALVMIALVVAMWLAIQRTGPYADEFFTLYITRQGPSLSELWQRWLSDNHPPLFYALAWLTRGLGEWVTTRRLINLGIFVSAVLVLVELARQRPDWRTTLLLFGFGFAGILPALERAAALRSFYLGLAAAAVAAAALALHASTPVGTGISKRSTVILALSLTIAINVHFVTTLIVAGLAAAFWLRHWLARAWRPLGILTGAGVIALAALIATLALQLATIEANTRSFWIAGGFTAARWGIQAVVEDALTANLALTLAGVAGVVLLGAASWRERRLDRTFELVLVLGFGWMLAVALLLVTHAWRPMVTQTYLAALYPPILLALALGAADMFVRFGSRSRLAFAILLPVFSLVSMANNLRETAARPSWNEAASAIASQVSQCPGTLVHVDLAASAVTSSLPPADNARAFAWAFRQTAAQWRFRVEPPGSHRMAAACPTIFWADMTDNHDATESDIAARLRQSGYSLGRTSLRRMNYGWVLVSRPL